MIQQQRKRGWGRRGTESTGTPEEKLRRSSGTQRKSATSEDTCKEDSEGKRAALALKTLTWRTQVPIVEKIKKIKGVPHGSPPKNRVDSARLVYFQGITKRRLGEVRKSLAALKIETKEVKDISFVGKRCAHTDNISICAHPNRKTRIWGDAIKHLENFNPLSSENSKRDKGSPEHAARGINDDKSCSRDRTKPYCSEKHWWR